MTDRRRILEEIAAAYYVRGRRAWEFTRREFAEIANCDYGKAAKILDEKVTSGELLSEQVRVNGKLARVYWRPGDVPESEG